MGREISTPRGRLVEVEDSHGRSCKIDPNAIVAASAVQDPGPEQEFGDRPYRFVYLLGGHVLQISAAVQFAGEWPE